jgi:hypothetical protein
MLLHLNGPPGIGKSTMSALYADRHPGTLNLDIDCLHRLVGGWWDPHSHTHDVLRPVALAMASTHLAGGRDVVLPQYLAKPDEIDEFSQIAQLRGAGFRHVVLLDEKAAAIARFSDREDDTAWGRHNRRVVAMQGGDVFLEGMYDRLLEVVRLRPASVIRSELGDLEATYASLIGALEQHGSSHFDGWDQPPPGRS